MRVSSADRAAARWISRRCDWVSAVASCRSTESSSAKPEIAVSMLLKSWAMPPASRPTASIFCDSRSCSSRCRRSEMSRSTATQCVTPPVSSATGEMSVSTQRGEPSRRMFSTSSRTGRECVSASRIRSRVAWVRSGALEELRRAAEDVGPRPSGETLEGPIDESDPRTGLVHRPGLGDHHHVVEVLDRRLQQPQLLVDATVLHRHEASRAIASTVASCAAVGARVVSG